MARMGAAVQFVQFFISAPRYFQGLGTGAIWYDLGSGYDLSASGPSSAGWLLVWHRVRFSDSKEGF